MRCFYHIFAVRTSLNIFLIVLYTGLFLLVGPLSGWFLLNAQTWVGCGLAVLGILTLVLPVLAAAYPHARGKRPLVKWGAVFLGTAWLGTAAGIILQAPPGSPGLESLVRHGFTGKARFNRFSIANIIPESEQVNLGFSVMPYLDPIMTVHQSQKVKPITLEIYREMAQDEDFKQLGSVMGWAYNQLLGLPFDKGHYYLYIPQNSGDSPLPVLVFLHGSAGNFKAYTWILSKFAEEQGFAIIAPSYGFGNWDQAGVEAIIRAIDDAGQDINIDADQIYLMGLSNGGLGVSLAAYQYPQRFRGLVFLSPVMATSLVDSLEFQERWRGRPVLVITGEADRRIPLAYVKQRVTNMHAAGIAVSSLYYPGEDHFLFFSQKDEIVRHISEWLAAR